MSGCEPRFAQADKSVVVLRSDMRVELVDSMGDDTSVVRAAKVSTAGQGAAHYVQHEQAAPKLIGYLMRNRHGSPFEHTAFTFYVEAPIFVWREIMRHRIACVSGDTIVSLCSSNGRDCYRNLPIEEVWKRWHLGVTDVLGRTRKLPASRNIHARTVNEDTMVPTAGKILDVVQSGIKETVWLTTDSGRRLRCTRDHRVLTVDGWKRVHDLTPGRDYLNRIGKRAIRDEPPIPPMLRRGIGVWTSGLRESMICFRDECYICLEKFDREDLVLDHVIPVIADLAKALDKNNLSPACVPCHRAKTNGEQIYAERQGSSAIAKPDRVVSIEPAGATMTYDLVIDEPWHNYLANGLVVHNSYNEESARYRQLDPVFYVPARERDLVQSGSSAHPALTPGSDYQHAHVEGELIRASTAAYSAYERLLSHGVAREVARMLLPVNIYSSAYVTMNARALMNFISLRTEDGTATYVSHPMREIEAVARQFEMIMSERMPAVHAAFVENGRVAP